MKTSKLLVACLLPLAFALGSCGSNGTSSDESNVISLMVSSNPNKTEYEQGEFFDKTGLKIDATYSDGKIQKDVDYKVRKKDALKPDDQNVTVAFGGKTILIPITVDYKGNNIRYSVAQTPVLENSSLNGKNYYFLGSSVTYGENSKGESMVDFIKKRNTCVTIKEAVSGTTLFNQEIAGKGESYVKRLEKYISNSQKEDHLDAFVVQLSTNDMYFEDKLGNVTSNDKTNKSDFDNATTYGALEYIIASVKETWNCPILIYTNNNIGNTTYANMVTKAKQIEGKWDNVTLLDLYNDVEFNNITSEQKELWLTDMVHPTRAGYRDWWTEKFEMALKNF